MQFHSPTVLMHEACNLKTEANLLLREQVLETERMVAGGSTGSGAAAARSRGFGVPAGAAAVVNRQDAPDRAAWTHCHD